MDGFFLKKVISFFIEPYGLIFLFFVFGIYLLLKNKNYYAKLSLLVAFFLYLLFAYPIFSNFLVTNLENQYPKYNYLHNIKYIHILGAGHTDDPKQPLSSKLSSDGIKRIIEGILIYKQIPNSKIILTSYYKYKMLNYPVNVKLAIALGVDKDDIIIGVKQQDTGDEADFTKSIVGNEEFVLVTSALHMPRAMMLFKSRGLNPIPAPTDFKKTLYYDYFYIFDLDSIKQSSRAVHEYMGILWTKMRG